MPALLCRPQPLPIFSRSSLSTQHCHQDTLPPLLHREPNYGRPAAGDPSSALLTHLLSRLRCEPYEPGRELILPHHLPTLPSPMQPHKPKLLFTPTIAISIP